MLWAKERERIRAYLGEGTSFKGQLNFEGTVRLDGKLEGAIITKDNLVLGATAQIKDGAIFVGKCETHREGGKPLRVPSPTAPDTVGEGQRQLVLYPTKPEKR